MDQNNNNNNAWLAFFGGAVAGATLGVLLAPGKVSDTFRRVAETAQRIGGDVISLAGKAPEYKDRFMQGDLVEKAEVVVQGVAAAKEIKEKIQGHYHESDHQKHESSHDRSHTESREHAVSSKEHKSSGKGHKANN